jgi:Helix-turn-helix domain
MSAPPTEHEAPLPLLPVLRFDISEAARILRMSRAQLYNRISDGAITPQKDGARTYITRTELERYVASCCARSCGGDDSSRRARTGPLS